MVLINWCLMVLFVDVVCKERPEHLVVVWRSPEVIAAFSKPVFAHTWNMLTCTVATSHYFYHCDIQKRFRKARDSFTHCLQLLFWQCGTHLCVCFNFYWAFKLSLENVAEIPSVILPERSCCSVFLLRCIFKEGLPDGPIKLHYP